jgi:hypothetical protein
VRSNCRTQVVPPSSSFSPSLAGFALALPPNHDASSPEPPKSSKLQAPTSRFTHSLLATPEPHNPSSRLPLSTVLLDPYSCPASHTTHPVHSAPRLLYLQNMAARSPASHAARASWALLVDISKVGRVHCLFRISLFAVCFSARRFHSRLVSFRVTLSSVAGPTSPL